MARAVRGDAKLREDLRQHMSEIRKSVESFSDSVMEDDVKVRNNMDVETTEEIQKDMEFIQRRLEPVSKVFEQAYRHHRKQTSVLPNNVFGQRRRIRSDGSIEIIDELDPMKFAERAKADGFQQMTPAQQAAYMTNGSNPPVQFRAWSPKRQREFLTGVQEPGRTMRAEGEPESKD